MVVAQPAWARQWSAALASEAYPLASDTAAL